MANQIVVSAGAKVRNLQDVIIGTSGVLTSLGFDVANGVPRLDVNGKILVSQLPNSVMEYKGTWSAATNTPTLANGTGNQGDVYLCNVAGTVDFGAGPIAFFVGDQVIYSGSIWQRASGATGTVTSVAVTETGDSLNITGSPIVNSGTINIGFNGTNLQYVNGAGNLTTFPILTGYVPYTGATQDVDLGAFSLNGKSLHIKGTAGNGHLGLKHQSAAATGSANESLIYADSLGDLSWQNANLYLSKFITSANTANRSYTFPNANGTVALTSDLASYVLYTGATGAVNLGNYSLSAGYSININGDTTNGGALSFKQYISSITGSSAGYTGISALGTTQLIISFNTGTINYKNVVFDVTNITNNTVKYYNLPNASGTLALTSDLTGGTVTSVAALTIGTSGTDLSSTVATSTTTPVITLNVPTASATNRGALSSADWTTFNNKQSTITLTTTGTSGVATLIANTLNIPNYTITNAVTGTGTTNYLPKFTGASTIGNSIVQDNSTHIDIGGYALFTRAGKQTIINPNVGAGNVVADFGVGSGMGLTFTTDVERMRLTSSGNLGLGVTPSTKLEVLVDVYKGVLINRTIATSSQTLANVTAFYALAITPMRSGGTGGLYFTNYDSDTPIIQSSNTSSVAQFLLLNPFGGNVGIGTTSPSYLLDVNGTFRATGAATFSSTIAATSATFSSNITFSNTNTGINYGSSRFFLYNGNTYVGDIDGLSSGSLILRTNGTDKLIITSGGAATFSDLAGTGTRVVEASSAGLLSATKILDEGTYTPTKSGGSGSWTSFTMGLANWTRVGNRVTVWGNIDATSVSGVSTQDFYITIPITSTNSTGGLLIGNDGVIGGIINNGNMQGFQWSTTQFYIVLQSDGTYSHQFTYTYTYLI